MSVRKLVLIGENGRKLAQCLSVGKYVSGLLSSKLLYLLQGRIPLCSFNEHKIKENAQTLI